MTREESIELFRKFLKEQRGFIYRAWIVYRENATDRYAEVPMARITHFHYIDKAFSWGAVDVLTCVDLEGIGITREFWEDLDNAWFGYLHRELERRRRPND